MATVDERWRPHLVPVCFAVEGDTVWSGVDEKPKSTPDLKRLRNIEARPWVTVLVDHYEESWGQVWWVRVDGQARVLADEDPDAGRARRALAAKYEQYADMQIARVVAVDVERWRGWSYS